MLKILLACMSGMSTSLLAQKMAKVAKAQGDTAQVIGILSEADIKKIESADADVLVCYTSVMAIDHESIRKAEGNVFDILMLGPQSSFMLSRIEQVRQELNYPKVPYCVIDKISFAKGDGEAVLKMAREVIANQPQTPHYQKEK